MKLRVFCEEFPIRQWIHTVSFGLVDNTGTVADLCNAIWEWNEGPPYWKLQLLLEEYSVPMAGVLARYLKEDAKIQLVGQDLRSTWNPESFTTSPYDIISGASQLPKDPEQMHQANLEHIVPWKDLEMSS
ncbi:Schizosaccharomyces specific protein [Schizosaccharomyces osmophilus]|uniref:Schizosaccharomyces specific protein n=1 Tax=Schizosaccharomyces osmophilus TaxID=2545709 RepID=A0AAE9WBH2_9SCHI|nr:Schizosaccharomyces specific protein [Schizosaccharomyces osmophilus]WBW73184.1 Schizosaccharomyces specific protein [Schizosaccharomyces osmophilus]